MTNDQVRIARALEVIARHNQEMIRVFAAMNENLAGMGKILAKMADVQINPLEGTPPNQLNFDYAKPDEPVLPTFGVGDTIQVNMPGTGDHDRFGRIIEPSPNEVEPMKTADLHLVHFDSGREAFFKGDSLKLVRKMDGRDT